MQYNSNTFYLIHPRWRPVSPSLPVSCRFSNNWHQLTCTELPWSYLLIGSCLVGFHSFLFTSLQSSALIHTNLSACLEAFPLVFCIYLSSSFLSIAYFTFYFGLIYCLFVPFTVCSIHCNEYVSCLGYCHKLKAFSDASKVFFMLLKCLKVLTKLAFALIVVFQLHCPFWIN